MRSSSCPMPVLENLGFNSKSRVAIFQADDVGMCHGANAAFEELARLGAIDCGSVMVPCPWFTETVEMAAANPDLDCQNTFTPDQRMENLSLGAYFNNQ